MPIKSLSALLAIAAGAGAGPALAAVGLPQLDVSTYAPQVIWLAISFALLYVLMARVALPRIGRVLEERRDRVSDNLEKAESLKAEAEGVAEAYEGALAEARAEAQTILRQAADQMAADADQRHARISERLETEIKAGEAHIAEARQQAVANIRQVVVEVAGAAAARLSGRKLDAKPLEAAVEAALKERGR
jgi:F-type H+-transporting ATPase subunit b